MTILETSRLILRHLVLDDLDPLYALHSDPEVIKFISDAPCSYQKAREELEWFRQGHPEYPQFGLWATVYKATGQLIGRCSFLPWTIAGQAEVELAVLLGKTLAPRWFPGQTKVIISPQKSTPVPIAVILRPTWLDP